MRIIVAGSRTATEAQVLEALRRCPWINFSSAVVSGTAEGADRFGELWAEKNHIRVIRVPADWKNYGKRAGPMRNKIMAERAEGLVAVWDGVSRGTHSMISLARKHGLRVFILRTDTNLTETYESTGALADLWERAEERASIVEFSAGLSRRESERRAGSEFQHIRATNDKHP